MNRERERTYRNRNLPRALDGLRRVLKPGGRLVAPTFCP